MNRYLVVSLISAAVLLSAVSTTTFPARADARMYSDRTVRFIPPPEYDSIDLPAVDLSEQEHLTPVAAYIHNRGKEDQLSIQILMEQFSGSLNEFETSVENDLRGQIPDLFVSKKAVTRLANGMPAYWMKLAYGEGFDSMQQYVYATIDGRRGIVVAMVGRLGIINEDKAREGLKNLAVVLDQ